MLTVWKPSTIINVPLLLNILLSVHLQFFSENLIKYKAKCNLEKMELLFIDLKYSWFQNTVDWLYEVCHRGMPSCMAHASFFAFVKYYNNVSLMNGIGPV